MTEWKIAEKLASAETRRVWLISQKSAVLRGLATVGHTEYTMLGVVFFFSTCVILHEVKREKEHNYKE